MFLHFCSPLLDLSVNQTFFLEPRELSPQLISRQATIESQTLNCNFIYFPNKTIVRQILTDNKYPNCEATWGMSVSACTYPGVWGSETTGRIGFPPTVLVNGSKLSLSGLARGNFTCWAISLAQWWIHQSFFFVIQEILCVNGSRIFGLWGNLESLFTRQRAAFTRRKPSSVNIEHGENGHCGECWVFSPLCANTIILTLSWSKWLGHLVHKVSADQLP